MGNGSSTMQGVTKPHWIDSQDVIVQEKPNICIEQAGQEIYLPCESIRDLSVAQLKEYILVNFGISVDLSIAEPEEGESITDDTPVRELLPVEDPEASEPSPPEDPHIEIQCGHKVVYILATAAGKMTVGELKYVLTDAVGPSAVENLALNGQALVDNGALVRDFVPRLQEFEKEFEKEGKTEVKETTPTAPAPAEEAA